MILFKENLFGQNQLLGTINDEKLIRYDIVLTKRLDLMRLIYFVG